MIGIVDYGMGNLLSVKNALDMVGVPSKYCIEAKDLTTVDRLILPGVGAFRDCMRQLYEKGFVDALNEQVLNDKKPILGICLGMQAMARKSFEGGEYPGLGWFDADVVRLKPSDRNLKIPQVGWNDITYRSGSPLFQGLPDSVDVYFVHAYHMKCDSDQNVEATCDYGTTVTAAVRKGHIFATQFHPEKSQDHGLKILENFTKWDG